MAYVLEETTHDELKVTLMVLQREEGEYIDPWAIIDLDADTGKLTPKELRNLGRWLILEGTRIGKEYKSNGARRPNAIELTGARRASERGTSDVE